jgi:hypothetical protein
MIKTRLSVFLVAPPATLGAALPSNLNSSYATLCNTSKWIVALLLLQSDGERNNCPVSVRTEVLAVSKAAVASKVVAVVRKGSATKRRRSLINR